MKEDTKYFNVCLFLHLRFIKLDGLQCSGREVVVDGEWCLSKSIIGVGNQGWRFSYYYHYDSSYC